MLLSLLLFVANEEEGCRIVNKSLVDFHFPIRTFTDRICLFMFHVPLAPNCRKASKVKFDVIPDVESVFAMLDLTHVQPDETQFEVSSSISRIVFLRF